MHVKVNINPMPAVRMTQKTMFYGRAAEYVAYKNSVAQELRLNLVGTVKGGLMEMTDKPDKASLPIKGTVSINAVFYRERETNVDIDNLLKTVRDGVQTAGILYNASQVRAIKAELYKGAPEGQGWFEFTLKSLSHELHLPKRQDAQIPVATAAR